MHVDRGKRLTNFKPFDTWDVLREVDKLMANVPGWQPFYECEAAWRYSTKMNTEQRKRAKSPRGSRPFTYRN